jgi:hypothetical protein
MPPPAISEGLPVAMVPEAQAEDIVMLGPRRLNWIAICPDTAFGVILARTGAQPVEASSERHLDLVRGRARPLARNQ